MGNLDDGTPDGNVAEDDIDFIFSLCRHGHVAEVAELIDAG